jgi:hypothetical protein
MIIYFCLYIAIISIIITIYTIIKKSKSNFSNLKKTKCKSKACELAYTDCTPSSGSWASTCDDNIDINNCNVCETCKDYRAEMKLSCQYFGGPFLDPTDECFLKPLLFETNSCNSYKTQDWISKNCKSTKQLQSPD